MTTVSNFPDVKDLKARVDLRSVAAALGVTLDKEKTPKEFTGPCPRCGGNDRLVVQAKRWQCRQCHKWDDAPAFVQFVTGASFPDACQRLADIVGSAAPLNPPSARDIPSAPADDRRRFGGDWHSWARRRVAEAAQAMGGPAHYGQAAAAYLRSRGISKAAVEAFRLGAWKRGGGAALTLPRFAEDGRRVEAFQYRIVNPSPNDPRYLFASNGDPSALFGLHLCKPSHDRLLIAVEGELNAVSIFQAARSIGAPLDVVSFGSESPAAWGGVAELAPLYGACVVWADNESASKGLATLLEWGSGGAMALRSPEGRDANDLLLAGALDGFLVALLTGLYDNLAPIIARAYEVASGPERAKLLEREGRLVSLAVAISWGWAGTVRRRVGKAA